MAAEQYRGKGNAANSEERLNISSIAIETEKSSNSIPRAFQTIGFEKEGIRSNTPAAKLVQLTKLVNEGNAPSSRLKSWSDEQDSELGTFDLYLKGTILIIKHAPQIYRATRDVVTDPIIRKTTGKLVNTLVTGAKTIYDDVNIYYYSIVRDKAEDAYNTASSAIKQGTNTVLNTVTDLYNNPAMRDTANTAYRTVSAMSESVSNAYSGVKEKTETAIKSVTESVKNGTAGIDTNTTINQATHYVSHYLLGSSPIRAKL